MDKTKATFNLSERAKGRLESLKARLRKAGVARSIANESAIVEALVMGADLEALLRDLT